MTSIEFPSEPFPGLPAVRLDRPQGWSDLVNPQAQLAIAKDVPQGEFRPNVVVVVARLAPAQTLESVAKDAAARLEAQQGYEEIGREEITISGCPGFRIEGSWTAESTGTVAQAMRAAVVEHDGVRDLVQITGTCSGAQAKELWPTIRAVQDSVEIGRPRGGFVPLAGSDEDGGAA